MIDPEKPLLMTQVVDQATVKPNGDLELLGRVRFNQTLEDHEVVDVLSEASGAEPEDVRLISRKEAAARRSMHVAFSSSRWNSSWDPSNN